MSPSKFTVVTERELGQLEGEQLARWKQLVARRKRLAASEARLERDAEEFLHAALADVVVENHPYADGVQVQADGRIVQRYCGCYRCQSKLQGLSPSLVVEAMIKQSHIGPDKIAEARAWAAHVEKKLGQSFVN